MSIKSKLKSFFEVGSRRRRGTRRKARGRQSTRRRRGENGRFLKR